MQATIDHNTFTIMFERSFSASREQVFDAWTHPAQLAQWWDPEGRPLVSCEIDLRPGGAFRFVNDGHSAPFTGTYALVERPARLVFEALGSLGTVALEATDTGSRMSVTIRCSSREHLEQFVKLGVAANTDRTLDNLVQFLGGVGERSAPRRGTL